MVAGKQTISLLPVTSSDLLAKRANLGFAHMHLMVSKIALFAKTRAHGDMALARYACSAVLARVQLYVGLRLTGCT
jgi:hypothetical protein